MVNGNAGSANLRVTGGLAAVLVILGLAWFFLRPAESAPKHVVIISIESLRFDHLGVAGYDRETSPNIDKLAERGTIFRRAYSQAPWTRPSVASTFTSTYPSTHDAANDARFWELAGVPKNASEEAKAQIMAPLAASFTTMAEIFSARGYRCFGYSCNGQISQDTGFGQGFEDYDGKGARLGEWADTPSREKNFTLWTMSDEQIVEQLTRLFNDDNRGPTMIFVHLMKPHHPYLPLDEFNVFKTVPDGVAITYMNFREINRGKVHMTAADIAYNIDLYDGTIRETDDRVGRILQALSESEIAGETLVVLSADHGEEFLDHGGVSHGHTVYEELIRVPLILAGPGIPPGKSIDTPVQNIDLLPTIASLIWREKIPTAQGRSLHQLLESRSTNLSPGLVFSEDGRPGWSAAVIDDPFKLIEHESSGKIELYDLINDPGEQSDLSADPAHRERVTHLHAVLRDHLATNRRENARYDMSPGVKLTQEVIEHLRALGYVK